MMGREGICVMLSLVVFGALTIRNADGLKQNFYRTSCPQVEPTVSTITRNRVQSNPALGAKLLRMHFHDCFVRVCPYLFMHQLNFYLY